MLSFIEKEKLLSLVASQCVTDGHIANYLQGLNYEAWKVDKDLEVDVYEEVEVDVGAWKIENYALLRKAEYPLIEEYMDAYVKGNTTAIKAYKDKCLAVKEKYPK